MTPEKPAAPAADVAPTPATQDQAIAYMNNEIIWARIIVSAWTDQTLLDKLRASKDNINQIVQEQATLMGMTGTIPDGTTLIFVEDTPGKNHMLMPLVENMPPGPLDMVPHSL